MTRAGVVAAANEVSVDLQGLAPNQSWGGAPNDFVVRESYMYDVSAADFTPDASVSDADAGTGFALVEGPFVSPTAADYVYESACFKAE